jgi:hypothetical protein
MVASVQGTPTRVFFHRQCEIRDHTFESQSFSAS